MQKCIINNLDTELYDLKAVVYDVAGNYTELRIDRLASDETPPTPLAITNITAITPGAPAIVFHSDGLTDIATGIEIRVWASAKDDEIPLPADRETAVATIQFYASVDDGDNWMDLGTIVPARPGRSDRLRRVGDWNTTGIPVGTLLWVGVIATDECGNETTSCRTR